ncbi:MAG: hypothetical protein M3O34_06530 [Chloroflexota bacterium]|nr:hypothetical protein [Chloroflexota bacterium]
MPSSATIRRRLTIAVDPTSRTARVESLPSAGTRSFAIIVEPDRRGEGWNVFEPMDVDPVWRSTFEAALGEAIAMAADLVEDGLRLELAARSSGRDRPPARAMALC